MPFGEFPEIRCRNFTRPPGKELREIIWEGEGKTWKAIGWTAYHIQEDQQDLPLHNMGHVSTCQFDVKHNSSVRGKMTSVFQLSSAKKTMRASLAVVYYSQ